LADAVIRLLSEQPRTVEELADALLAGGLRLGRNPLDLVEDLFDEVDELHPAYSLLDGETMFWPGALLTGSVFTHVVTSDEVRHDLLLATPDFSPLGLVVDLDGTPMPLTDDTSLRAVLAALDPAVLRERGVPDGVVAHDAWLLEPGWFVRAGFVEGDVIAVTMVDGRLALTRTASRDFDEVRGARARGVLHDLVQSVDGDDACEIDQLVATAIAADPTLFAVPVAPLGELLTHSGFTIQGDFACAPGVDLRARRNLARVARMESTYGLTRDDAEVVLVLHDLVSRTGDVRAALLDPDGDPLPDDLVMALLGPDEPTAEPPRPPGGPTVRRALDRLADPDVAEAAAVEILGLITHNADALELTAELLEPMVSRQARPAVRWLRAKAQERLGRVLDAEQSLEAAYSLDPQWAPVLFDLARFAGDRGDVERGLSLLHRAGAAPDDRLLEVLEDHRAADRADLGRNDPCWCGSGRRYKACHRGRERLDLPDRAGWLYTKAWTHLMDGPGRLKLLDAARAWADDDDERALVRAIGEDIVIDTVLFEGGVFADFVATRGVLLPDDERLLAEQWLLVDRSVHEVEEVRRDRGLTARDIRTGDRHDVTERLATRQLRPGDLILARLVPDGRDTVIFGGLVAVDLARRDMLVALLDDEPDPVALVEFVRALHAPPTVLNADGTELVVCEARLRVADPATVAAWLDARLEPVAEDGTSRTWHAQVDHNGGTSVRASVTLEGSDLVVFTMNEERFDDLLDSLLAAHPDVEIVEQSRRTLDDVDPPAPATPGSGPLLDPGDVGPEITAVLHQYMRDYEQRWLDESIPALGGVTPREAAADPTRRDDLVRLLDSFPQTDDLGRMSAARLRKALDLR
jgi:hypothetical protein